MPSPLPCRVFGGGDRWGMNLAAPAGSEHTSQRQLAHRPLHLAHAFDIVEKPDAFELLADAPGFTTDNINITLDENGTLTVSGKLEEKKEETSGEGEQRKVWRSERRSQQFTRSFALPENTKPEEICASLDKGVLTVRIPKKPEEPKPEPRRIEVKTA